LGGAKVKNLKTLIKYLDMFKAPEGIPYKVFEVELQDEMFDTEFIDLNWDETFRKYNIEPFLSSKSKNIFTNDKIASANLELLAAMVTYVFRGCIHWWECDLFEYSNFFIQSFARLKELVEEEEVFNDYLIQVCDCPLNENYKNSICCPYIKNNWTTLLGWGNPKSDIVFVGINPLLTKAAEAWHKTDNDDKHIHAIELSKSVPEAKHFSYHKRILRELINSKLGLETVLPEEGNLKEFAFFTEVNFCPSEKQSDIPMIVLEKCFNQNTKPFILDSKFKIVITVGKVPSFFAYKGLIDNKTPKLEEYHGKLFEFASGRYLITSYHPNARGNWNRSAVSERIIKLIEDGKLIFRKTYPNS